MLRCKTSRASFLFLAALLLAACQPGNINRVSLPNLSKGMTAEEARKALDTVPKCSVLLGDGRGTRFDVYRLVSASYSLTYYLMFEQSGGLRYWGAPGEFLRHDAVYAQPARAVTRHLQGRACGGGESWKIN